MHTFPCLLWLVFAVQTNEQPQNGTVVTSPEKLVDQFSSVTRSGLTSTFNWKNLHMYTDYDVLFFILVTGVAMFFFSEMWVSGFGRNKHIFYPLLYNCVALFCVCSLVYVVPTRKKCLPLPFSWLSQSGSKPWLVQF